MLYQIDISHRAHQDIEDAACYIAYQLKNPSAAQNLVRRAFGSIDSLEELPARFSVVRDPFLASLSIRFVPVQGYLAFYQVNEVTQTVHILRFFVRPEQLGFYPENRSSPQLIFLPALAGSFYSPLLQFNEVSLLVKHFFLHRRGFACAGADFVLSYA